MTTLQTPRGPIIIRTTRADDADLYRDLRLEALRIAPTAFGMDVETTEQTTLDEWRNLLREGAGEGSKVNYVAEAAGQLIGMTVFVHEKLPKLRHQGNIFSVYVQPSWRGMGILDALVTNCLSWARSRNVRIVKLSVSSNNAPAIRAYMRLGFQIYGVDPEVLFWKGVYYDELLMYRKV